MTVLIRDQTFEGVKRGDDLHIEDAVDTAQKLYEAFGPELCTSAVIDRFDGLVLIFSEHSEPRWRGWHFKTPTCGYHGLGPSSSARILALFEFGTYDDILDRITEGGENANFPFAK